MDDAFYLGPSRNGSRKALLLIWLNAGFAAAVVAFWSGLYEVLGKPLEWALWTPLSSSPILQEYPFVFIWSLPGICALAGWIARANHSHRAAATICVVPILLLALVTGWFYLAPQEWR